MTAPLLFEWRYFPEMQLLIIDRNNKIRYVVGDNADELAALIRSGAGSDQVEEKIEEMRSNDEK